jgi:hypothetical protein
LPQSILHGLQTLQKVSVVALEKNHLRTNSDDQDANQCQDAPEQLLRLDACNKLCKY